MSGESSASDIVETSRMLYRKGRSDGLPVIPPTEDRVEKMLTGTDLPPDHVFGHLGNRQGKLSVETLAINAVMAGCLPVHMPVLVAGARAMADPDSTILRIAVSTGSWGYLWLINGPIRKTLQIQSGANAFGPTVRANRSIGRALGLAYKNTALVHPGEKNMGVQGNPFRYSLVAGENEEESPWEPLHVTEGFDETESTITFGGPNTFAQYTNRRKAGAYGLLKDMIYNTPTRLERSDRTDYGVWAIHILSPKTAGALADAGLSKQDVKQYHYENSDRIVASHSNFTYGPDERDDESIPQLRTPHRQDPDRLKVVVIGGDGPENAIIGPALPGTVTKKISIPDAWDELVAAYVEGDRTDW